VNDSLAHTAVVIEPAAPEHLAEIASLAAVIWRAHYPGIISPAQIDYMLARMYDVDVMRREFQSGIVYERLLLDGQLRGFSSYGAAAPNELKLHKLYIHPACQRRGFAALMLERVEEAARRRGCPVVVLTVNKRNANALAAYRKHGFAIRESVVADIGGGFVMDDYVMVKRI